MSSDYKGDKMIRLILALIVFLFMACSDPTGSDGVSYSDDTTIIGLDTDTVPDGSVVWSVDNGDVDTLYLVTTEPTIYQLFKGGDSVGSVVYTVSLNDLDETNGFALTKLTERVEGEGWDVSLKYAETGGESKGVTRREFLTAPQDKAYYYNLSDSTWQTIKLSVVLDSMKVKGVWQ